MDGDGDRPALHILDRRLPAVRLSEPDASVVGSIVEVDSAPRCVARWLRIDNILTTAADTKTLAHYGTGRLYFSARAARAYGPSA